MPAHKKNGKWSVTSLVLSVFLAWSCVCCGQGTPPSLSKNKLYGISWEASNEKIEQQDVDQLKAIAPNALAIIPFAYMRSKTDTSILFNSRNQWRGEREEGIKEVVALMSSEKWTFMMKPQIWIGHGTYTGEVTMGTESDWLAWEESYTDYMVYYAKLAESLNFHWFCLGTELDAVVRLRPKFWVTLAKAIRKVFSGKLTYASNWDSFEKVTFSSSLDALGIDAYFPLSDAQFPTEEELLEGWEPWKSSMKKFANRENIPIVFTEYGYRNIEYSAREPWDSSSGKKVSHQNQIRALEAMYKACWEEPWMIGGFLWKWKDKYANAGGEAHTGFTVQRKPAEQTLRAFYSAHTK